MGIPGLWETIKPIYDTVSFVNMCVQDGFERRNRGFGTLLMGVDLNELLDQCGAIALKNGLHGQIGENAQTRRPPVKRGRTVKTTPLWYLDQAKTLIRAFGFYYHEAPGEAEAELAELGRHGLIDAIITNDSDTFVFGGQCILRSAKTSSRGNKDIYHIYYADAIENSDTVGLTRGGLLIFALLAGGDYDDGITGCGRVLSLGLARGGFGDSLLHAAKNYSPDEMATFLGAWRKDLKSELLNNTQHHLGGSYPTVASRITDGFPNLQVLDYYVRPATSWSNFVPKRDSDIPVNVNSSEWKPREPAINLIASFCIQKFGWTVQNIEKKLHKNLWPGIVISMLRSKTLMHDAKTNKIATPNANAFLIQVNSTPSRENQSLLHNQPRPIIPSRRATISTTNFVQLMNITGCQEGKDLRMSIPVPLLPTQVLRCGIKSSKRTAKIHIEDVAPHMKSSPLKPQPVSLGFMDLTGETSSDDEALMHSSTSATTLQQHSLEVLDLTTDTAAAWLSRTPNRPEETWVDLTISEGGTE